MNAPKRTSQRIAGSPDPVASGAVSGRKAYAAIISAIDELNPEQKSRLDAAADLLSARIRGAILTLAATDVAPGPEPEEGEGFGDLLDLDEGRARLSAYATAMRLEDWAGDVAGPGEIEARLGVKRSTLHDWRMRGAVIGLKTGARKHVFPLAQFIDGRPVEGMAHVLGVIGDPRAAWRWLTTRKPSIGGAPLDLLKRGKLDDVAAAARRDFA